MQEQFGIWVGHPDIDKGGWMTDANGRVMAFDSPGACRAQALMERKSRPPLAAMYVRNMETLGFPYGSPPRGLVEKEPVTPPTKGSLTADDIQWVVNDTGELGVKIGSQFFFMYKGGSLVYEDGLHDDGTSMLWRAIGKREFGETCKPLRYDEFQRDGFYRRELDPGPGRTELDPDSKWQEMPRPDST